MATVKESEWIPYEDGKNPHHKMTEQEANEENGKLIDLDHILDTYINTEIRLPSCQCLP